MMTKSIYFIIGLSLLMGNCSSKKSKFARKEDEPLFANIDSHDSDYKKTVEKAQSLIPHFQQELAIKSETSTACVKIFVSDNKGKGAFIWLVNPVFNSDSCTAEIFEIPGDFTNVRSGDKLNFNKKEIQDWYILDKEGKMQGGYSLQYMRQRLSTKEQIEFDKYIGVKTYSDKIN